MALKAGEEEIARLALQDKLLNEGEGPAVQGIVRASEVECC